MASTRRHGVLWVALAALSVGVAIHSPAPPVAAGEDVAALRGRFDAAVSSGDAAAAQAQGKLLLADAPEDPLCIYVLRTFLAKGWAWPRLTTSFATLRRWEQDEIDTAKEPDLRLAFLDAIDAAYPKEDAVRDGGTHYERAWTCLQAKRYEDAVRLSREHVRRFAGGSNTDKVRVIVLAPALLGLSPPDVAGARKALEAVAADERSRYGERAERMLDELAAGACWIDVADGCPREAGLGKVVLLTDLPADSDHWKALTSWRTARGAEVVRFRPGRLHEAADALRKSGPEFVAVAVTAAEVDTNLQWEMVELCRNLDGDPMPDFHFGYLVARDAADLAALAARSVAAQPREAASLSLIGTPSGAAAVAPFDAVLHYGHGTPRGVIGGLDAATLKSGELPRAPLIVSGACYNAAIGRSWDPCTFHDAFSRAVEITPNESIALAWLHAGALGVVAATEADRGEMAAAEWAWLRSHGGRLGEIPTLTMRLAFATVPEKWKGMPRQRAGAPRSLELFDVMLRGQLSRCLIGDPAAPFLAAPVDRDPVPSEASRIEDGRVVIEVRSSAELRNGSEAQFLATNTLTRSGMNHAGFTERRLFARVAMPAGVTGRPGRPAVAAARGDTAIPLLRSTVRHEVWGGRRFICVQTESADSSLAAADAAVTFTFPVGK